MSIERPLSIARLTLTNYRCYEHQRLETGPDPVVLTGSNGAGKTSVLEALSMLAPGRGLRRARLDDMMRWQTDGMSKGWAVAARLRTQNDEIDVGTGCVPSASAETRDRRQVRIEGKTIRGQSALAELFGVVWLTPEMDRLFQDGASGRRRFLDRLVFGIDPAHSGRVAAYERAMQERSRLLRRGKADPAWLAALEDTMATKGVSIAAARREAASRLTAACARGTTPFPAAALGAAGVVEGWLEQQPALAAEDRLRAELHASRSMDGETGGASVGPHKSDLEVRHTTGNRPANQCSTGEQKVLLIAIVLASARVQAEDREMSPILLLDEVAAHLDARHRSALFEAVAELNAQAWYAGTDPTLFAPLRGRAEFFAIENATATPIQADDRFS